jgi:hypothetical protein
LDLKNRHVSKILAYGMINATMEAWVRCRDDGSEER